MKIRPALAAFLALTIAVGAASPVLAQKMSAADFRVRVEAAMAGQPGGVFPLLQKAYPDEVTAMIDKLYQAYLAGTLDNAMGRRAGLDLTKGIAERDAALTGQAPDAELMDLARANSSVLKALRQADPRACAEFGEGHGLGDSAAAGLDEATSAGIADYATAQLKAIIGGKLHPTDHRPLTDAEAGKVGETYVKAGGNVDWLHSLGDKPPAGMNAVARCDNAVLLADALLAQPKELIVRYMATN